jgi:hypothetical protein
MRKIGGSLSTTSDTRLLADATLACGALGKSQSAAVILNALKGHDLDSFTSHLVILLAAQYQCPSRVTQATQVMVQSLNQSSAAA